VETVFDAFRSSVLISGLVLVMMMLIECLNVSSGGSLFVRLRHSRAGQVFLSALLGVIPGCMGGFASVSLYTHGMISFGALVAMMIASSGDEAFVMLAMFPGKSLWIFLLLFVIAVAAGILTDIFQRGKAQQQFCTADLHKEDLDSGDRSGRHFSWKRFVMLLGTVLFIAALVSGVLAHDHSTQSGVAGQEVERHTVAGFNLLDENWMNILFGILSLVLIYVILRGKDHFVEEHLWHHIVCRHLPRIFLWTFPILLGISLLSGIVDISTWIGENIPLMILLAALVGIIPESGPHLIFVTLYASGVIPLPVLLASCISQDGHASLPLLAESRRAFLKSKIIGFAVALVVGFGFWLLA